MKLNVAVAAVLASVMLTACQGQNPFKREKNPIRNYPRVADSINKRDGAIPYGQAQRPVGNAADCTGPFIIRSNSPNGTTFYFLEDSASSFEVSIINRLGDSFEVTSNGVPEGAEFKLLRQTSNNSAAYQLSWTPKGTAEARSKISLQIRSKALGERCQGAMGTEDLFLVVEKVQGSNPVISVSGLPQTAVKFGREVSFNVDVTDSQASAQSLPILNGFGFDAAFKNESTADLKVIDGSPAAACENTPKAHNGKWRFACKFRSAALQANDQEGLVNSGKTASAVLTISGKSATNNKSTNTLKLSVKVLFERQGRRQ